MFYKLLVLSTFLVASSCLESEERDNKNYRKNWFHCGGDEFQRNEAKAKIFKECPGAILELNHCCAIHDDCYDQQLGQTKCDEDFNQCNQRIVTREPYQNCSSYAYVAEILLSLLGEGAYKEAVTNPYEGPFYTCDIDNQASFELRFINIHCRKHRLIFSSCAFNYQVCVEKEQRKVKDCVNEVKQCISVVPDEGDDLCDNNKKQLIKHFETVKEIWPKLPRPYKVK